MECVSVLCIISVTRSLFKANGDHSRMSVNYKICYIFFVILFLTYEPDCTARPSEITAKELILPSPQGMAKTTL
jgi:hypothetical protein